MYDSDIDSDEDFGLELRLRGGLIQFCYAVVTADEKLVLNLIAAGWDVNEKTENGDPPLAIAIRCNDLVTVEVLINAGAIYDNNYFRSKSGPLHLAARCGSPEIVEFFIKLGVVVNTHNEDFETPIFWATWLDKKLKSDIHCKIIKILYNAGANINARDVINRSPLSHAASRGFYAAFQLLLSMGADIYMDGEIDSKLLDSAARSPNLEIVKWAVEHGYDVNTLNEDGLTPLHSAACASKSEIVELLLNNGAKMNINRYNEDPLCYAVNSWSRSFTYGEHIDRMKCFELLIAHGANLNRVNNKGRTPLYIVLQKFQFFEFILPNDFVHILLKNGSELDFDHEIVRTVMNNTNGLKFPHLLLRHTAMFQAQSRQDGPTNFDLNKLNDESRTDYTHCRDELESMKATKIEDTNVSFFNVLVDRDIGPYTRNENIRKALEDSDLSKRFPIYSDLLTDRFSAELKFQKLLAEATIGLSHVLNWNVDSTRIILNNILCYLDKKDLNNLRLI